MGRPARAHQQLPRFAPSSHHTDTFCLSGGSGIRVGYAQSSSPANVRLATAGGRIVLALTANPYYKLSGTKPGSTLGLARRRLKLGKVIRWGPNDWYMAPGTTSNGVLKVRHGIVEEVGIANRQLTSTRRAQSSLLRNF